MGSRAYLFAYAITALAAGCCAALAQDAARSTEPSGGQLLFNNACRTCHTLREGDNRLGPNLHRIVGRKAGSLPGYNYSSALKQADIVWDKASLDRFIAHPDEVAPGNNMKPYSGLGSAEDRAKIIGFREANAGN
jgi:cytochrome c